MAQTGFERPQTGRPELPPKVSTGRARQGWNIKGMSWVLMVSIGLVVAASMVMLALQQWLATQDGQPAEVNAPATRPSGPQSATPETAQSPPG